MFRGTTPVIEDDASDIAFALAACEDLASPRSTEHYAESLRRRLDKDQSPLLALNEGDLVPPFAAGLGPAQHIGKLEDPSKKAREHAAARAMATVREQVAAANLGNPSEIVAKIEAEMKAPLAPGLEELPDPANPESMAQYFAALEIFENQSQRRQDDMRTALREQLDDALRTTEQQLDRIEPHAPEKVRSARERARASLGGVHRMLAEEAPAADAASVGDGPPKPQGPAALDAFREAKREPDPKLVAMVLGADAKALASYRASAHYAPPARLLDEPARLRVRRAMLERRSAGESLAEGDFTRGDLSGLNLEHADLRRALMEGVDLTRTAIMDADLSGAVLAHATLRDTWFEGSTLEGANLGSTQVERASFAGAKLRGAIFARSSLRSASFRGADLTSADWVEAQFGEIDFEGAILAETVFLPIVEAAIPRPGVRPPPPTPRDLTRCRFRAANLKKASFLQSLLSGVDFTNADLENVTFLSVVAGRATFRGACARKLHAVMGCSFEGACFEGADLTGAFLRGSNLRGASFAGARLDGADLSECDLTGANLAGVQAKEMLLVRADLRGAQLHGSNLMAAMLQSSKLYAADLSNTNLFAANLGRVRVDATTRVQGANLKRALMLPKYRPPRDE